MAKPTGKSSGKSTGEKKGKGSFKASPKGKGSNGNKSGKGEFKGEKKSFEKKEGGRPFQKKSFDNDKKSSFNNKKSFESNSSEKKKTFKREDSDENKKLLKRKRPIKEDEENDQEKEEKDEEDEPNKKKNTITMKAKEKKPNYELLVEANHLWEKVRITSISKEERNQSLKLLIKLINGKLSEIIHKHDASRIIQTCIKHGSPAQRDQIFDELKPELVQLAKSQYGHFLVSKFLKYIPKRTDEIIEVLKGGDLRKLLVNKQSFSILETIWTNSSNKTRRELLLQFYGPELALFKGEGKNLKELLEKEPNEAKRKSIISHLEKFALSAVNKGAPIVRNSMVHSLLEQYFENASYAEQLNLMADMKETLVEIIHTREGARVGARCVSIGSAKDRKTIIKGLKGYVLQTAKEEFGHLLLLRILDVVDDGVLVTKDILNELFKDIKEQVFHPYGRLVFLHVLSPRNKHYFNPYILEQLEPPMIPQIKEETGETETVVNYKKTPEARRAHLLPHVSKALLEFFGNEENLKKAVQDKYASEVLFETLWNAEGDVETLKSSVITLLTTDEDLMDDVTVMRFLKQCAKSSKFLYHLPFYHQLTNCYFRFPICS
eukprot:TRINITY_DN4875_c0_g1_i1.p1 TRINITY_DN4875_c0_g1~~TRINITY_DN4875_c0_g1_i1.p1  ORF type:complete len:605 (-),score=267.51 TRINITY_DN4875_c0_g1_i1:462-2276(-)